MKQTLSIRLREWKYWHIDRKTQKIVPWAARKLPRRLKYYVVIDGMSLACVVHKDKHPTNLKATELLKLWSRKEDK